MSAVSVLNNALDRQRARLTSEFVSGDDSLETPTASRRTSIHDDDETMEEDQSSESSPSPILAVPSTTRRRSSPERRRSSRRSLSIPNGADANVTNNRRDTDGSATDEEEGGVLVTTRTSVTLAQLEEERELVRRRSAVCMLLSSFVLFRLWILAIEEADFGLLLLCLACTSWAARFLSFSREREEELDRRIQNYANGGGAEDRDNEIRMLSFQAQLALAIMESQRELMQGGHGHPDGASESPGVSEQAMTRWKHFKYSEGTDGQPPSKTGVGYGSVKEKDSGLVGGMEDLPHCSICLGEYEQDEDLCELPCSHVYHDECISSWTANHTKCPLCNFELESVTGEGSSPADGSVV